MAGTKLFAMGLLIVFLLPATLADTERRRLPGIFYMLLALVGLAAGGWIFGAWAALLRGATALAVLAFASAAIAFTQRKWRLRPISGSTIKLVAAVACWLPPFASLMLAILAIIVMPVIFAALRSKTGRSPLGHAQLLSSILAITLYAAS